jgi:hypothetical protein
MWWAYHQILEHIPSFQAKIDQMGDNPDDFQNLCQLVCRASPSTYVFKMVLTIVQVSDTANDAKNGSVHTLKRAVISLFHDDPHCPLYPAIDPMERTKINCGFAHPEIGYALFPHAYNWDDLP